jgi:CBS domain-containing protein
MQTGYSVEKIMRRNVLCIEQDAKVIDCAKLMAEKMLGSAVVCKDAKVVGIITEQDLARRVLAKGIDPNTVPISEFMTRKVHTISPQEDIYDAMVEMGEKKIKHLPVVKNGKLLGIVSFKDIIRIQPDMIDLISFKSSLTQEQKKSIFSEPRNE